MKAPTDAIEYYGLDPKTATMREVILSVRADEAVHRSVNHHFSDIPDYYDIDHEAVHVSSSGFRDLPDEKIQMLEDTTHKYEEMKAKLITNEIFDQFTNDGHPKIVREEAKEVFEALLKKMGITQIVINDELVEKWFKVADKDHTEQLS
jgi:hypothetical protein